MSLRSFLIQLLLGAVALAAPPPNIVILVADDLGINDLSCYGREDQPTPNLDRLAGEGMRFTAAYCAQPLAAPSHAAILTGRAPARLQLTSDLPARPDAPSQRLLQAKSARQLPLEEKTAAELLKPAGYATAFIGSWPLGGAGFGAREQGFEVAAPGAGASARAAAAEQFIDASKDRPFFLYLATGAPMAGESAATEEHKDAFNPGYAAAIEALDDAAGRVLARLDALALADRTLVVITSASGGSHLPVGDAGPATQNTPFRAGKGFLYEGGLRVPLLVRWPGKVAPGSMTTVPVLGTDWLPTWLEAAGAATLPGPGSDGVSLLPVLTGGDLAVRPLHWHLPHYTGAGSRPAGAIRQGGWKLVEHFENGRTELFDLASDPGERADVSAEKPDQAAELRGKLAAWRQAAGAVENAPNPRFDPNLARQLYEDVDVSTLEPVATAAEARAPLLAWRAAMDDAVKSGVPSPAARPVIVLHARTAKIHGTALRYEPEPQKNTLGFWKEVADWASWDFELKQPGEYAVEILQGYKGREGAEVEFGVGGQMLVATIEPTGHFQNFVPRIIGHVRLPAGKHTLTVKPKTRPGGAVMDLRQVVLLPPADEPKEEVIPE